AAQQSEANALLSLRFCMGYPLDSSLHIQHDLFPSFSAPAAFDSTALPLYPQHNLQVAMAGQDRKARLGHLYPQLNMRAGFQQTGFGDDIGFLGSDNWFSSGYIGVQLQIPLFSLNKMHYTPARYRLHLRTLEYERQHYLQEGERN